MKLTVACGARSLSASRQAYLMRVETIEASEGLLRVRCSGIVGVGTESVASVRPVTDAVADWITEHPGQAVQEIVMDFRDVDYRWGDAPVSGLMPLLLRGVRRVHYIASVRNASALESLLGAAKIPGFSVERVDA